MTNEINDDATLSRRQIITALAVTAGAATVAAPQSAEAQGASVQRMQAVPGLQRPQNNGRDIYSHVVVTSRQRTVYIAGQLARDAQGNTVGKGDIKAQMRQVCENLKAAVTAAGGTLADIVQTSTFVTDWTEFRKAMDVRHEYLGAVLPTSTTVQVSALASPDFMVEISAIAVLEG